MKINKLYTIALIFLFVLGGCGKLSEGMTGSKRSKSSDEFFVHKKKPLVLPPGFNEMPMPKPTQKKQAQDNDIEDLLGIKNQSFNLLEDYKSQCQKGLKEIFEDSQKLEIASSYVNNIIDNGIK